MIWSNLKKNKCPRCSRYLKNLDLKDPSMRETFYCPCGFTISLRRFKELTSMSWQPSDTSLTETNPDVGDILD